MRKIYLSIICLLFAASLSSQTVLRYDSHGLVADHVNDMKITEYVEPGTDGNNVVWDFRTLELVKEFTGKLDNPSFTKGANIFTESNSVLEEFGNLFFFNVTKDAIEQHGYMSGRGTVNIVYDQPFVKMRYPFTYGSSFAGSFDGRYNSADRQLGTLTGSYAVKGDGMGVLMLPGNYVYENALRVKEVKSYTQTINNRSYDIETVTYRWYVNEHRFPILVLIESTHNYESGRTHTSTQAAYNPIVFTSDSNPLDMETVVQDLSLKAYPNPYHNEVNLRFDLRNESKVNLSVYDLNGRLVKVLVDGTEAAGERMYKFSAKEMGLSAGAYIVKLNVNGEKASQRILELQ